MKTAYSSTDWPPPEKDRARSRKKFTLGSLPRRTRDAIAYEEALNPEQLAAVTAPPGPVLVVAGAGTGKTRVITYRVAYLLDTGVPPDQILLLTFTNKAAREMMNRVEPLTGARVNLLWGGTFHHVAHRVLRAQAQHVGYRRGYTILDREDSRALLRACASERSSIGSDKRFPQPEVLESIKSLAANTGMPVEKTIEERHSHLLDRSEEICAVLEAYEARKRTANAMDYDDLLCNWNGLLKDSDQREAWRARFRHILVDEYQDTNWLQREIVDHLAGPEGAVTVVGDDAQAIYGWRGATAENILTFPGRYPECRIFRLETNYRSTPEILEVANRSLEANSRRFAKTLRSCRKGGAMPEVVPCRDALQQCRFVAENILRSFDDGTPLEHMAVLYRSHWNAMELQMELQRRDIPFRVRGGIRFFEQAHIKDVTAFLRVVANPSDEIAWLRILPLVPHIGPKAAQALAETLRGLTDAVSSLAEAPVMERVPRKARRPYLRFAEILRTIGRESMQRDPAEMIRSVVSGYYDDALWARYSNAHARREDLNQLCRYAAQFDSVERFLSDLALSEALQAETAPVGPEEDRYVTLSTVHQAKGLEWPVVYVIWLADGRFPTDYAGRVDGGYEEERRLFHVAVTRARDELVLAYPMTYHWRGMAPVLMKRSRFLAELDEIGEEPCYDLVEIEEP